MKRIYEVEFRFVSRLAHGDDFSRSLPILAGDAEQAERIAGAIGFSEFGELFTENCIDWNAR